MSAARDAGRRTEVRFHCGPLTRRTGSAGSRRAARRCFPLRLLAMMAALLLLCECRDLFFRRNADLRLVRQAQTGHILSPVWARDGTTLFFLFAQWDAGGGELRRVSSDGSGERLLLEGEYVSVSPSPDGHTLAVSSGTTLLVDTSGSVLDTLASLGSNITQVRFGGTADTLYCTSDSRGILRFDLHTRAVDTASPTRLSWEQEFDVSGDSLLSLPGQVHHLSSGKTDTLATYFWQSRFCPCDPAILLGGVRDANGFQADLVLLDRRTNSAAHVGANPYSYADIIDPCWSPDGKRVAFAAAKVFGGGLPGEVPRATVFDLWVLEMN